MSVYCTEFTFDGISSKEYNLIICSFDGGQSGEMTAGSHLEFTTFKAPNSSRWLKTSASYNEQLTFTFQVCKYNPFITGKDEPLSERELAFLIRWLVRKDYKWLKFIQEGYENISYRCQISAERYMIGGQCYGLNLTVTCDAPFGWSDIITATISSSTSNTVWLYDSSDEIGEIYPKTVISVRDPSGRKYIQSQNTLTRKCMQIHNCLPEEEITIKNMGISSTEWKFSETHECYEGQHPTLFDDFNYDWLTIGNTFKNRENEITVTGNCIVTMKWRVPRKAVI